MTEKKFQEIIDYIKFKRKCTWFELQNEFELNDSIRDSLLREIENTGELNVTEKPISLARTLHTIKVN